MKTNVLIVAKTRRGAGACVGGITEDGRSVRLEAFDAEHNEHAGLDYEVGEWWEVEATRPARIIPPHVENIVVRSKRKIGVEANPIAHIASHMPPKAGGPQVLYDGLALVAPGGPLFISESGGLPPYSTLFWRPDRPLYRDDDAKRIRYRYPLDGGGCTLTFVGFQEPVEVIPAGAWVRVSLAHWWRPDDRPDDEKRCYVQLSGWFLPETTAAGAVAASGPRDVAPDARTAAPVAASPHLPDEARHLLKSVFGYDSFWPLQEEIVANILQRRDTLVIMPTGGGKSLCYQLPALRFDGLTVVVSPLIALMKDQVDGLREMGAPAVFLNSTLDYTDYVSVMQRVKAGKVKLLYVAPETLLRPETLLMLEQARLTALVIDEAHCISEWGHDFRPEYRQLLPVRQRFPGAVCVALTATATPRVRQDIKRILGFAESNTFLASFDRPNLYLGVQLRTEGLKQTLAFLDAHRNQPGIIYCSTRTGVDELAAALQAQGWPVLPYHAGMEDSVRVKHQNRFIRGDDVVMVATIAFGMGIDKPNVRFVLHYNLPQSLESYYQEIGRAGRDGIRSDCLLLYGGRDVATIEYLIRDGAESERPDRMKRLKMLVHYVETDKCRRAPLLRYFGEASDGQQCGMCDNCLAWQTSTQQTVISTVTATASALQAAADVSSQPPAQDQLDVTIPAQKFLSCVKRTGEKYGATRIIDVLRGSRSKAVLECGHDRLSTYGIGREYSPAQWQELASQLVAQGMLKRSVHGILRITRKGYDVLRGERFHVKLTSEARSDAPLPEGSPVYEVALFEKLRVLRRDIADSAGLPSYVVFHDRTLMEMAALLPQSPQRLLAVNGVGQTKMEKYGQLFLEVIRSYCTEHNLPERPHAALTWLPSPQPATREQRVQAVGQLFASGRSISELQAIYGVQRYRIIYHLTNYHRAGGEVDGERLLLASALTADEQERVLVKLAELGPDTLRPVFDALDGEIPWDELHLMRLYYAIKSE